MQSLSMHFLLCVLRKFCGITPQTFIRTATRCQAQMLIGPLMQCGASLSSTWVCTVCMQVCIINVCMLTLSWLTVHVCVQYVCMCLCVCLCVYSMCVCLCACVRMWNIVSQSKASLHVPSLSVSCLWYPLVGHTPQDKANG